MTLKLILKNMFARPGRFIVLQLCVMIACIAAYAAFDMGAAVQNIFSAYIGQYIGKIDCSIISSEPLTEETLAELPTHEAVFMQLENKREVKREEKYYTYELTESVSVYGFADFEKAQNIEMLHEKFELGEDEVAIGRHYSESYGYQVGDSLTLSDPDGEPFEVTVAQIFEEKGFLSSHELSVVAPMSVTTRMSGSEDCNMVMIDSTELSASEFTQQAEELLPGMEVTSLALDEFDNIIRSVNIVLYLTFVLTFLLVVFVTVSFTEKIIMERMSTIGTLRSIGMSRSRTSQILVLENLFYGIIGSLLGTLVYALGRNPLLDMSLSMTEDENSMTLEEMVGTTRPYVYVAVILGAMLLEMAVPLWHTLRAVKTPIRDIIFATKDTEYEVSLPKTIVGAALMLAGLVMGFAVKNPYVGVTAVLLLVIGAALSVQFAVKWLARGLQLLFAKLRWSTAEFACVEAGSKKSDMGNAVLTVTTIIAAAAIFIIGTSMLYWTERPIYDTDVIVSDLPDEKTDEFLYITEMDMVDSAEFVYTYTDEIRLASDEKYRDLSVFALPKGEQYIAFKGLPDSLGMNELCMDRTVAERFGVAEGQTFTLVFHADGMFPIERKMTLVRYCNTLSDSDGGIVLSPSLYRELYGDKPRRLLLRSDAGEDALAEHLRQVLTEDETITTMTEYTIDTANDSRTTRMGLYAVIGVAMVLTLIGIFGNQIIGFEARRREFALLHSTAMSRGKLVKLILIENLVSFGISILTAAVLSVPITLIIAKAFVQTELSIVITLRIGELAVFAAVILAVVMLSTLTPIRQLFRMNTANEIKYE